MHYVLKKGKNPCIKRDTGQPVLPMAPVPDDCQTCMFYRLAVGERTSFEDFMSCTISLIDFAKSSMAVLYTTKSVETVGAPAAATSWLFNAVRLWVSSTCACMFLNMAPNLSISVF